jgi:chromosome segregation ATPase
MKELEKVLIRILMEPDFLDRVKKKDYDFGAEFKLTDQEKDILENIRSVHKGQGLDAFIAASSEAMKLLLPRLMQNCQVESKSTLGVEFGRIAPKLEKVEAKLSRVEPKLGRVAPKLERVEPKLSRVAPKLEKVEPKLGRVAPKLEKVEPKLSRVEPKLGRVAPKLEKVEPKLSRVAPKLEKVEPKLSRVEAKLERIEKKLQSFKP